VAEKRSDAKQKKRVRVRVPKEAYLVRFFLHPVGKTLAICLTLAFLVCAGVLTHFYTQYSRLIDQKLRAGPFANTSKIFAAPRLVAVGDTLTAAEMADELGRAGYTESHSNATGYFQRRGDNAVEIYPGPDSYDEEAGVIKFAGGRISQIVSLRDNTARPEYRLEPQLITNLSDRNREKRRLVKFADIPKVLIDAVTSAEDKRFFQHAGFDPIGMMRAAYVDLREGRKDQGASTLSMQLAREFFLDKEKRWTRKLAEILITIQLEQRLTKEEIFEDYSNQIYLGSRGTFRIHGFGEAAEAFLGKDLKQITLPEAAELASLPRWPAYFDPFRHPDHLLERRNAVLVLMRQNGYVSDRDYAVAREAPLTVAKGSANRWKRRISSTW
jgi:penicillin-binding protein 1B